MHMASSYAYASGNATVVCATLRLAENRYCGNFMAISATPDGRREIHECSCPGIDRTLADALIHARAMAEASYPPTRWPPQESVGAAAAIAPKIFRKGIGRVHTAW